METFTGILKFDYSGRIVEIPYSMDFLGGSLHIYFEDKNGINHRFFRSQGEWRYGYNKPVGWPQDFLTRLSTVFDLAAESHGL